MNNRKQFLQQFEILSHLLADRVGISQRSSFTSKFKVFIKKNPSYAPLQDKLKFISDLRNFMVHEDQGKEYVVPSQALLNMQQSIIKSINNPQKALDIATPGENIFSCRKSDELSRVIKVMNEKNYTHVPVYNPQKKIIGVFSENALLRWVAWTLTQKNFKPGALKVADIMRFLNNPKNDYWEFIPRDMTAFKIREKFYNFSFDEHGDKEKQRRIGVVFVTENGKKDEDVLGLITAWDLLGIEDFE
jgi:CBS domain-containing protein